MKYFSDRFLPVVSTRQSPRQFPLRPYKGQDEGEERAARETVGLVVGGQDGVHAGKDSGLIVHAVGEPLAARLVAEDAVEAAGRKLHVPVRAEGGCLLPPAVDTPTCGAF